MSDGPETSDAPTRRASDYTCSGCGGVGSPMDILDSRQGKVCRLFRCMSCEKLDWTEQR